MESLVAVSITAVAGAALLTSLGAAVQSGSESVQLAVARGLGEQLMDEIAATRLPPRNSPVPAPVMPERPRVVYNVNLVGTPRTDFDVIDDYDGWVSDNELGPTDRDGNPIGKEGHVFQSGSQTYTLIRILFIPDWDFVRSFRREVHVAHIEPDGDVGWRDVTADSDFRRVTVRVNYIDGGGNQRTLVENSRVFGYVPLAP